MREALSPLSIHIRSLVSLRDLSHEAVRMSYYTTIEDYELDGFGSGCDLLEILSQNCWGHAVATWLRHCATKRKVAGSIPDSVTGIFH